jgi:hypothetical protein
MEGHERPTDVEQSKGRDLAEWGAEGMPPLLWASPLLVLPPIVAYAIATEGESTTWSVMAVASLTAAAALVTGVLVGFLFGLPRTLARPESEGVLSTNTNLDEISDWLTKILVGLGLIQLGEIASGIDGLATSLEPGLGNGSEAHAFAVGLLIYAAIDGFLVSYLWTRIDLSRRLRKAAEDLAQGIREKEQAEDLVRSAGIAESILSEAPPPPPPLPSPPPSAVDAGADQPPPEPGGEQ